MLALPSGSHAFDNLGASALRAVMLLIAVRAFGAEDDSAATSPRWSFGVGVTTSPGTSSCVAEMNSGEDSVAQDDQRLNESKSGVARLAKSLQRLEHAPLNPKTGCSSIPLGATPG
jgi:hypothetical protein